MWSRSGSTSSVEIRDVLGRAPDLAGSHLGGEPFDQPQDDHVNSGASTSVHNTASFASSSVTPVKARFEISSETVKPIPAQVPAANRIGPLISGRGPCSAGREASQLPSDDPDRLADHIAHDDPEEDRRFDRPFEQAAGDVHAGVGEREQRQHDVADPRVQFVLHALVGRDRGRHPPLHRSRELGRGLLAERTRQRAGPLEVPALGRVGARHEPHGESADERVDARLQHRHPQRHRHHDRRRRAAHGEIAQRQQDDEQRDRGGEGHTGDVAGVDDRDHAQRGEVVEHRQREQEDPHAGCRPRRQQRQHTEREGRVGGHRRAPSVSPRARPR